jgi:hypothetical protein
MTYQKAIVTNQPELLPHIGLQCGQWIRYGVSTGRYIGVSRAGTVLIAWRGRAGKAWPIHVAAGKNLSN